MKIETIAFFELKIFQNREDLKEALHWQQSCKMIIVFKYCEYDFLSCLLQSTIQKKVFVFARCTFKLILIP